MADKSQRLPPTIPEHSSPALVTALKDDQIRKGIPCPAGISDQPFSSGELLILLGHVSMREREKLSNVLISRVSQVSCLTSQGHFLQPTTRAHRLNDPNPQDRHAGA